MKGGRVSRIEGEFDGAEFGDLRLSRRLVELAGRVSVDPEASFPVASENDADLEATYRFFNNGRVTREEILEPHVRSAVRRCASADVVVAHDTSEFNFGDSPRADLGRVGQGKSFGFYGHFALAVDRVTGQAHGVLSLLTHERTGGKGRRGHTALQSAEDNESRRWLESVRRVEQRLGVGKAIHVMDREGDSYALMADLVANQNRFVVRMASEKRKLEDDECGTVGESLRRASTMAERDVPITARRSSKLPGYRKHFPQRNARTARLEVTATKVTILRPCSSSESPAKTLTLNAVRVFEPDPPTNEPPVEWRLWTTESIDTPEQVLDVVDAYRCRWVIEEYFKALKTGCAIEKRQLESSAGLTNVLAFFAPIAWRLLQIRTVSRDQAGTPANKILTSVQVKCLALALIKRRRPPLPPNPTARDAMLGVAALGGHIKNNGDPGWIVLGRGLDKLLALEEGYRLATSAETYDQS